MGALLYGGRPEPQQGVSKRPAPALRFQRGAEHLHRLGPRATAEFLAEIVRAHGIERDVAARLDAWRDALTPELVRAAGADRFPPSISVLRGDRA